MYKIIFQACSNTQNFLSQNLDDAINQFVTNVGSEDGFNEALQSDCDCRQWAFQFLQPKPPTPIPTLPVEQHFEEYEEQTEESDYQTSEEEEETETVYHDEVDTTLTSVEFTTTTTTSSTTAKTTSTTTTTTTTTTSTTTTSAGRTYSTRRSRLTTAKLRLFATDESSQLPIAVPSSSFWNPQPTEDDFLDTNSITEEVKPGLEQVKNYIKKLKDIALVSQLKSSQFIHYHNVARFYKPNTYSTIFTFAFAGLKHIQQGQARSHFVQ